MNSFSHCGSVGITLTIISSFSSWLTCIFSTYPLSLPIFGPLLVHFLLCILSLQDIIDHGSPHFFNFVILRFSLFLSHLCLASFCTGLCGVFFSPTCLQYDLQVSNFLSLLSNWIYLISADKYPFRFQLRLSKIVVAHMSSQWHSHHPSVVQIAEIFNKQITGEEYANIISILRGILGWEFISISSNYMRTSVLVFGVITTFRLLCPTDFARCMSLRVSYNEYRTEPFIGYLFVIETTKMRITVRM